MDGRSPRVLPGVVLWIGGSATLFMWTLVSLRARGMDVPWTRVLFVSTLSAFIWILLAVPIVALVKRSQDMHPLLVVSMFTALAPVAIWLHRSGVVGVRMAINNVPGPPRSFGDNVRGFVHSEPLAGVAIYALIVAAAYAFHYFSAFHARDRRALELERRLTQAQLDVLRMQLQPHFLFNTLHSISAIMQTDIERARSMMAALSDLLRNSLVSGSADVVQLSEELRFARHYVELQQLRYGSRLTVQWHVREAAVRVPRFLLQPLIENAIRHSIDREGGAAVVRIDAGMDNDVVELRVRDNGAGFSASAAARGASGLGLANLRARLDHLYGDAARIVVGSADGGGTEVRITIPAQPRIRAS